VLLPMYAFFFLLHFNTMVRAIHEHLPDRYRATIERVVTTIDRSIANFFRGRLIICLLVGTLTAIGWTIVRVPYPLPLGAMAGILTLVPFMSVLALPPAMILAYASAVDTAERPCGRDGRRDRRFPQDLQRVRKTDRRRSGENWRLREQGIDHTASSPRCQSRAPDRDARGSPAIRAGARVREPACHHCRAERGHDDQAPALPRPSPTRRGSDIAVPRLEAVMPGRSMTTTALPCGVLRTMPDSRSALAISPPWRFEPLAGNGPAVSSGITGQLAGGAQTALGAQSSG